MNFDASILVVEDDHDTREVLRFLLAQHFKTVDAVESVEAAIESYERKSPDLLVADIGMPGYNGYALIARIRMLDDRSSKHTPAIALTAYSSDTDRERALSTGFDAYLEKPFDPAGLIQTIGSLLTKEPG
jgi:CheY-like chemotaxis protein